MDSVQFPRGTTWLTRNRFKNDQGTLWMTVPVWKKGRGLQRINKVMICHEGDWVRKHVASLKNAYARAPFFEDHIAFLERIFNERFERMVDLSIGVIGYLMEHLGVSARINMLSELNIDAKEPRLSLEICKRLGASVFLAQAGAKKFLDPEAFQRAGIGLEFFNPKSPVYPQLWGNFIPNLSVFDLLFNCGPKAQKIIAKG